MTREKLVARGAGAQDIAKNSLIHIFVFLEENECFLEQYLKIKKNM